MESALWMFGQVPLTVGDLLDVGGRPQARLAFLSACETGLIGTELPDEVVGLAAGFMQAGTAGVVSTLWSVADESTALLAERFYENWKGQGMSPLEALVAAQQWLRDEADRGRWAHPYYWAAFTLTGV
jgi:CHAT domain-containing protein